MRRVYLDNNATTPVLPEVFEAMRPYFSEHFGNASSIHHHGQETRAAVEDARDSVAALLGCRASEIIFTSGGTEADNLAIAGLADAGRSCHYFEHRTPRGAARRKASGRKSAAKLPACRSMDVAWSIRTTCKRALRPNTKLISIMMANNETGVLQPVEEIGKIAAEADVLFSYRRGSGCGQSSDRRETHRLPRAFDFGHKIPRAAGRRRALRPKGNELQPLFYGGRHERSRRAGTENVPGIVGLGKAAEQLAKLARSRRRQKDGSVAGPLAAGNSLAGRRSSRQRRPAPRACRTPPTFISITSKASLWSSRLI